MNLNAFIENFDGLPEQSKDIVRGLLEKLAETEHERCSAFTARTENLVNTDNGPVMLRNDAAVRDLAAMLVDRLDRLDSLKSIVSESEQGLSGDELYKLFSQPIEECRMLAETVLRKVRAQ